MKTIGIIGCGNMGSAIIEGLKKQYAYSVLIWDKQKKCLQRFKRARAIRIAKSSRALVAEADYILLAVKPQDVASVISEIAEGFTKEKVLISIAAGVTIVSLQDIIPERTAILRAMPNLPLTIGRGITACTANRRVRKADRERILKIFSYMGQVRLVSEKCMDAVTAISGSGPGYIFYFLEGFIQAARELGFSEKEAELFVKATVEGSILLWDSTGENPRKLRERITSKKGTTEEALRVLKEYKWNRVFAKAVKAAYKRSKELSLG